jgi:hypothetical protein
VSSQYPLPSSGVRGHARTEQIARRMSKHPRDVGGLFQVSERIRERAAWTSDNV